MNRFFIYTQIALIVTLLISACKPSAEREDQYWANHQQKALELREQFPGFAGAIEVQLAEAAIAMQAAQNVEDEEAKAEAMQAANKLVSGSFVGTLGSIQNRLETIADQQARLGGMRMKKSVLGKAETALESSYRSVRLAKELLAEGAMDPEQAEVITKEANSHLITAGGKLSSAIRAAKKSMKKPKAKKKKKKATKS